MAKNLEIEDIKKITLGENDRIVMRVAELPKDTRQWDSTIATLDRTFGENKWFLVSKDIEMIKIEIKDK
jgi:hypothetical protein